MTHVVDPLRTLRPRKEEELEQLAAAPVAGAAGPLAYDVYRAGGDLVIEFDVPGVDPCEIGVAVEGRSIVVSFRRGLTRGAGVEVIEAGRQHGSFQQRLSLGERWDLDGLTARAENGVLSVRAPLVAAAARRRIEVTSAAEPRPTARAETPTHWSDEAEVAGHTQGDSVHSAA